MAAAAFDRLAERYDEVWTRSPIGRNQRDALWQFAGPLFQAGDRVLDLGCGTGEDAVRLSQRGVDVVAIDASAAMVAAARARGVRAQELRIEELDGISGRFDGAISNFGPLNCVRDFAAIREPLGNLIRLGGYLAICLMGRFCLWESAYYALRGDLRNAVRRWSRDGVKASVGVRVYYPSVTQIRRGLAPQFRLVRPAGVGVCVPPSYVSGIPARVIDAFGVIDRRIGHLPLARAISDHRLLVFERS